MTSPCRTPRVLACAGISSTTIKNIGARCAPARSTGHGRRPPVIAPILPSSRPAQPRLGEARSPNYPGRPSAAFCNSTLLHGTCVSERSWPASPRQPVSVVPGRGPSRAHTAPVRARAFPVPGIAGPGYPARLWPPPPQLADVRRHAAAVSAEPRHLDLKRVQTEAASGLAASREDSLRRHRPEPPRRRPAQPWQVTGVPGPRHQRHITTRVPVYQRVSRCVTASEWVSPVLLLVPAVKV